MARSSPAVSGPDRTPGTPAIARGRIAGNIYRRNPDIRSRLSAFTGRDASAVPARERDTYRAGGRPGMRVRAVTAAGQATLMILILPAEPGCR